MGQMMLLRQLDIEAICHILAQECSNLTSELAEHIKYVLLHAFCSTYLRMYHLSATSCIHTSDVVYSVLLLWRFRSKKKKISLRCQDCSMIYNYTQYGNKSGTSFRFNDSEREAVEV